MSTLSRPTLQFPWDLLHDVTLRVGADGFEEAAVLAARAKGELAVALAEALEEEEVS